jgi:signal transduction histidine kinase
LVTAALLRESQPERSAGGLVASERDRLVRDERRRIARELHDIVSFGFATIAMHAGIAAHMAEARPEQAVEALKAIRTASRDVLDDVRAVLGQLRDDEDAFEPARGIGSLERLAQSTSSAGVRTSVQVVGQPRPLPVVVDQSVYRIIQEALANVLRHSPGASASVTVVYEQRCLVVTVEDDGAASCPYPTTTGCGYGIVGMRERALALGGALDAAPRPGGGFRVLATLPFRTRP